MKLFSLSTMAEGYRCSRSGMVLSLVGFLLMLQLYFVARSTDAVSGDGQLRVCRRSLAQVEEENTQVPFHRTKRFLQAAKRRQKQPATLVDEFLDENFPLRRVFFPDMTTAIKTVNGDNYYRPGNIWLDTEVNPIQAHGGGVLYDEISSTYYWYGEYKDVPEGSTTGRMHIDTGNYSKACVGVAISDSPTGPFDYLRSLRPHGRDSRDMTVFKHDDGVAYLIYSSKSNSELHIGPLTNDYLDVQPDMQRILVGLRRKPRLFLSTVDTRFCPGSYVSHHAHYEHLHDMRSRLELRSNRRDEPYRMIREKSQFDPIPMTYEELLLTRIEKNLVTSVQSKPKESPNPDGYDVDHVCSYHIEAPSIPLRTVGH
ncbi:Glycosyl hydrolase family protein 43 isoform 2 [Hibiscus syriacus]|uniref:Glycosyl hydrolase family protein 43 isoform 2 n=1 Tax=Hibiscus syriacus TaxID=106335 RepID=A0A6A2ZNB3_HIBSY|nr:Glycosyl hydrolase family protein 43 isoform 2 [Hibiscus syriacus]